MFNTANETMLLMVSKRRRVAPREFVNEKILGNWPGLLPMQLGASPLIPGKAPARVHYKRGLGMRN